MIGFFITILLLLPLYKVAIKKPAPIDFQAFIKRHDYQVGDEFQVCTGITSIHVVNISTGAREGIEYGVFTIESIADNGDVIIRWRWTVGKTERYLTTISDIYNKCSNNSKRKRDVDQRIEAFKANSYNWEIFKLVDNELKTLNLVDLNDLQIDITTPENETRKIRAHA